MSATFRARAAAEVNPRRSWQVSHILMRFGTHTAGAVSQRICSGPRICSAGIYSLADLFRISRKSANLFRMGNGRCFFDTDATRLKVHIPF